MDQAGSNDIEAAGNNVSPSEHEVEVSSALQSGLGSAAGPATAAVASAPATVDLPLLALRDTCHALPRRPSAKVPPLPSDTRYWWNSLLEVLLREDRGLVAGSPGYPVKSAAATATSAAAATSSNTSSASTPASASSASTAASSSAAGTAAAAASDSAATAAAVAAAAASAAARAAEAIALLRGGGGSILGGTVGGV